MERIITNKEEALEEVKKSGWNIHYLSNSLKCDPDVIKVAIASESQAIQSCPKHILEDKQLALNLVKDTPLVLEYLDYKLRDNYSVVMMAVRADGYVLDFASDRLKGNKQIVLEAMKTSLDIINFASEEIKIIVGIDDENMFESLKQSISKEKFSKKLTKELFVLNKPAKRIKI